MSETRDSSDWWRGCVIYQIYPRSFQDSTGDGSGDLAGHHRAAAACRLARRRRGLAVALLQVADGRHGLRRFRLHRRRPDVRLDRGFRPAGRRGAPARPQGDHRPGAVAHLRPARLVQAKAAPAATTPRPIGTSGPTPRPDGTAPNNWLSVFGGPAWEWDGTRKQYYMHNFLASQPDLNFHNGAGAGRAARDRALLAGARRRRLPAGYRELLFPRQEAAQQSAACRAAARPAFPTSIPMAISSTCTTRRSRRTSIS